MINYIVRSEAGNRCIRHVRMIGCFINGYGERSEADNRYNM